MARKKINSRKRSSRRTSKKRYHKRRQQKGGEVVDVMNKGVVTEDKYPPLTQPKTMNVVTYMSSESLDTLERNLKELKETKKAKSQSLEEKIREMDSQIDGLRREREKAIKEKADYEKKYFDKEDKLFERIKLAKNPSLNKIKKP